MEWGQWVREERFTPAVQLRLLLTGFRKHGVPFDRAWARGFDRIVWPHDTEARVEWKDILSASRDEWSLAYERLPAPAVRIWRETGDPVELVVIGL